MAKKEPKVEVVTMTPEFAKELLEKNPRNRNLSPRNVNRLSREMANGRFRFNGDAIRIRNDGSLADGQHRLAACIDSGVSFETILMRGLDDDDVVTIDTGRSRSTGDSLSVAYGLSKAALVSSSTRFLVGLATNNAFPFLSVQEIYETLQLHSGIAEMTRLTNGIRPATPALVAAIAYVGSAVQGRHDRSLAFIQVLKTGIPDYEGCAAHRLRENLLRDKIKRTHLDPTRRNALYVNAWNKFVDYTPTKILMPVTPAKLAGWDEAALKSPPPMPIPADLFEEDGKEKGGQRKG